MPQATTVGAKDRAIKVAGKDIPSAPQTESSSRVLSHAQGYIPDALRNFDSLPNSAYVRQPVVEALFGYSASTVWRRVKSGNLPAPEKLGGQNSRTTAWNVGKLRRVLRGGGGFN
jgi:predicted DNA-binding transcriptional regulator AlpA